MTAWVEVIWERESSTAALSIDIAAIKPDTAWIVVWIATDTPADRDFVAEFRIEPHGNAAAQTAVVPMPLLPGCEDRCLLMIEQWSEGAASASSPVVTVFLDETLNERGADRGRGRLVLDRNEARAAAPQFTLEPLNEPQPSVQLGTRVFTSVFSQHAVGPVEHVDSPALKGELNVFLTREDEDPVDPWSGPGYSIGVDLGTRDPDLAAKIAQDIRFMRIVWSTRTRKWEYFEITGVHPEAERSPAISLHLAQERSVAAERYFLSCRFARAPMGMDQDPNALLAHQDRFAVCSTGGYALTSPNNRPRLAFAFTFMGERTPPFNAAMSRSLGKWAEDQVGAREKTPVGSPVGGDASMRPDFAAGEAGPLALSLCEVHFRTYAAMAEASRLKSDADRLGLDLTSGRDLRRGAPALAALCPDSMAQALSGGGAEAPAPLAKDGVIGPLDVIRAALLTTNAPNPEGWIARHQGEQALDLWRAFRTDGLRAILPFAQTDEPFLPGEIAPWMQVAYLVAENRFTPELTKLLALKALPQSGDALSRDELERIADQLNKAQTSLKKAIRLTRAAPGWSAILQKELNRKNLNTEREDFASILDFAKLIQSSEQDDSKIDDVAWTGENLAVKLSPIKSTDFGKRICTHLLLENFKNLAADVVAVRNFLNELCGLFAGISSGASLEEWVSTLHHESAQEKLVATLSNNKDALIKVTSGLQRLVGEFDSLSLELPDQLDKLGNILSDLCDTLDIEVPHWASAQAPPTDPEQKKEDHLHFARVCAEEFQRKSKKLRTAMEDVDELGSKINDLKSYETQIREELRRLSNGSDNADAFYTALKEAENKFNGVKSEVGVYLDDKLREAGLTNPVALLRMQTYLEKHDGHSIRQILAHAPPMAALYDALDSAGVTPKSILGAAMLYVVSNNHNSKNEKIQGVADELRSCKFTIQELKHIISDPLAVQISDIEYIAKNSSPDFGAVGEAFIFETAETLELIEEIDPIGDHVNFPKSSANDNSAQTRLKRLGHVMAQMRPESGRGCGFSENARSLFVNLAASSQEFEPSSFLEILNSIYLVKPSEQPSNSAPYDPQATIPQQDPRMPTPRRSPDA